MSGELKTAPDGQPERERSSASTELKGDAENADIWLKKVIVDGIGEILYGPDVEDPRVPVEVETQGFKSWAG